MANQSISEATPVHHTAKVRQKLTELVDHLRGDVGKVSDPRAQALFETTAEVLLGLRTAYEHFEQRTETAWKRAS
ncbi:MAG TPA: hypothetical protein VG267_06250 [Terracidiphilus sp.]|jgi:hypothetical protein|nr:hypothetical protein [Terracidiphilus sp.]